MKTVMGILFLMSTACAQTTKPNELACGNATLTLSMPQARAIQILKENGYTLTSSPSSDEDTLPMEFWVNFVEKDLCNISFANNKLVYVRRGWGNRVTDGRSAIEAVIDAVQSIANPHLTRCEVGAFNDVKPSSHLKGIDIECNGHTIQLMLVDAKDIQSYDIEESIGSTLKR